LKLMNQAIDELQHKGNIMILEAIVAVYVDWGIGCRGTQPLVIPADRIRFQKLTTGQAIAVGRKTLADFPGGKPLSGRRNYVLTRGEADIPGAVTVRGVEDLLKAAECEERIFVAGGESVYMTLLPHIRRIYVTKIDASPKCDTYFPDLDKDPGWSLAERREWQEHEGVRYCFCEYERTNPSQR